MADQNDLTTNVTQYDENGNKVGIVLKNGIYRIEHRGVITSPDGTKDVTVTTDGSAERLDVSLGSANEFQLQAFTPVFNHSAAGVGVSLNTSTDTSLLLITDVGKIDFISIAGSSAKWEVVLKINGAEVLRIPMSHLGSDLGLSNANNVPLWVETANKNFRYSPKQGVDFTSSFEVLAKAKTGSPSVEWLVNHRVAV